MLPGRRLVTLVAVAALVGIPAVALRAMCVGKSCAGASRSEAPAPFCSLDPRTRALVSTGFYEDRSPDALAVTPDGLATATRIAGGLYVPWPAASNDPEALLVPLVFLGEGIWSQALPADLRLDQVAPTIEPLLGIERPHPEVRSGGAIEGVVGTGVRSPLVVLIVMKGVGSAEVAQGDLADDLAQVLAEDADDPGLVAGTATVGSLPLDPAAVLTTIGTGGLPSEHGITGSRLRDGEGGVTDAFAQGAPTPVIATLGDDLDEATGGDALIGLVASHATDRGLIGGTWYPGEDDDMVIASGGDTGRAVGRMLRAGMGESGAADLLGVTLSGSAREMTAEAVAVVRQVRAAVPDAHLVITATGALGRTDGTVVIDGIWRANRRVATPGSAGVFVDRTAAPAEQATTQEVIEAMSQMAAPDGSPLFADVFASFAVRFGGYC